jgi:hypothetical protein
MTTATSDTEITLREAAHLLPRAILNRAVHDGSLTLHRRRKVFYVAKSDIEWLRNLHCPAKPIKNQDRRQ